MHNLFIALKFKWSTKYKSEVRKQVGNIRSYGTQINKIIAQKFSTDILIDDITKFFLCLPDTIIMFSTYPPACCRSSAVKVFKLLFRSIAILL